MKKTILLLIALAGSAVLLISPASGQSGRQEWLTILDKVLTLEKFSLSQYETDAEGLNISMPYRTVIPEKQGNIETLAGLFTMQGASPEGKPARAVKSGSINQAYRLGIRMEKDLITYYEWLIRNAENREAGAALKDLQARSRSNLKLFEHGLKAGRGMGSEFGPGGTMRP